MKTLDELQKKMNGGMGKVRRIPSNTGRRTKDAGNRTMAERGNDRKHEKKGDVNQMG